MYDRTNIDRRAHEHRQSSDRRDVATTLPRLIDTESALDAARQALAVGEALAAERILAAAEWKLVQS